MDHSSCEFRSGAARRRLAYSLAAGASAVGFGGANAEAAVLYSGPQNLSIASGTFQLLKLNNDEYNDLKLENYNFNNGAYQGGFAVFAPGGFVGFAQSGLAYASALTVGTLVDQFSNLMPEVSMAYGTRNPNAQFNDVTNAYIGFAFPINTENHFGWMRLSINNAAKTFVVHDWAYEGQAGVGIKVGALPLTGDYNSNDVVDAADYVIWRKTLGSTTDLRANGDNSASSANTIDGADYAAWRGNFGSTAAGAGVGTAAVPEPISLGLLAAGSLGVLLMRRARQGTT